MRGYFLIAIVLITSCGQLKVSPPPATNSATAKIKAQAVFDELNNKPEWLFSGNVCPADIIPVSEKPTEYLDEGCLNNPKGCLEDCKSENGNACYALGLLLQQQIGIVQDVTEMLFVRSCKFGIISGCTNRAAGKLNLEQNNIESTKCAVDTFEKTCQRDDPWGCTMYGLALAKGWARQKNFDESLKVMAKSCKYGDDDIACQEAKRIKKEIEELKNKSQK